jgi:hypothetical protein
MKKLFLYIILIGVTSCETEKILFEGPYFVRFTDAALTEKESFSQVIKIEVHNAGPKLTDNTTIAYSISGSAREGVDFEIVGTRGQVTIEEGDYFGYIEVQLINNANNILRSQDVVFTLTNVNSSSLEVGQGEGAIGKKFTLTILDDCILGGMYTGQRAAFAIPVKDIAITSSDCETYRLSNWNINIFSFSDPLALNFIDNGDNTITIKSQEQDGFPEDLATIQGFGSVNPETKEIFLTVTLVDFDGSPEVSFTLKPE